MKCPQCKQQVDEGAKFCSACGAEIIERATDFAWIAGIQEEIKDCRSNETAFGIICGIGILILAVPLVGWLLFPVAFDTAALAWAIPLGLAIAIAGGITGQHYHNKIKKLTQKLKGREMVGPQ